MLIMKESVGHCAAKQSERHHTAGKLLGDILPTASSAIHQKTKAHHSVACARAVIQVEGTGFAERERRT